jgi:hypothetical protein
VNGPGKVIDELADVLFALDEGRHSTAVITSLITREIVRWALAHGWSVQSEARVRLPQASSGAARERPGFIDLIVRCDGGQPDLAIEIDSTDKAWSLAKLRHAAAAGLHAIWIRWGDEAWAGAYDDVDVIQLPARRRGVSRWSGRSQLTFWP